MERFVTQAKSSSPRMPVKGKDKKAKLGDPSLNSSSETLPNINDTQMLITHLTDLFTPQFEIIKAELGTISSVISSLSVEVKQFSNRMLEMENRVSELEDQANVQDDIITKQNSKIANLQLRLDDLEDRSRRNNIRIIGLPETQEFQDLYHFTSYTLPQALGFPQQRLPIVIERAHRTGPKNIQSEGSRLNRMCIFRILNYQDKVEYLRLFKKRSEPLLFGNNRILLFQDYSVETSSKRKIMAPLCSQLINKGFNAWMVYPASIIVEQDGARKIYREAGEVKKFINDK